MLSSFPKTLLGGLCLLTIVDAICPLCATPTDFPRRFDFVVPDGRTCVDVYLDLVMIDETSDECAAQKTAHQELCCSIEEPEPVYVYSAPTAPPVYSGPVGDEPDCPICDSMEYPGLPNAFIVARYVGEYTCSQLYNRGFHGLIPNFMCGPLQDFAHAVCGCGQYNPRCQEDPTQCWDYIQQMNSNQTAAPSMAPSVSPIDETEDRHGKNLRH